MTLLTTAKSLSHEPDDDSIGLGCSRHSVYRSSIARSLMSTVVHSLYELRKHSTVVREGPAKGQRTYLPA